MSETDAGTLPPQSAAPESKNYGPTSVASCPVWRNAYLDRWVGVKWPPRWRLRTLPTQRVASLAYSLTPTGRRAGLPAPHGPALARRTVGRQRCCTVGNPLYPDRTLLHACLPRSRFGRGGRRNIGQAHTYGLAEARTRVYLYIENVSDSRQRATSA